MTGIDKGLAEEFEPFVDKAIEGGGYVVAPLDLCERILAALAPPASEADMRAFGASDEACYRYPGKDQAAERVAFCAGAALAAKPDQTALLLDARTALFNLGMSHNTFVQMLGDVDTSGPQKGTHHWRLQLGKAAVQYALGNENAAAEALTRIDQALADTRREG